MDVRDAEPEQVLRDALRSASLFVTRYSNDLIITSEEELTASLPEGYFNAIVVREVEDTVPISLCGVNNGPPPRIKFMRSVLRPDRWRNG